MISPVDLTLTSSPVANLDACRACISDPFLLNVTQDRRDVDQTTGLAALLHHRQFLGVHLIALENGLHSDISSTSQKTGLIPRPGAVLGRDDDRLVGTLPHRQFLGQFVQTDDLIGLIGVGRILQEDTSTVGSGLLGREVDHWFLHRFVTGTNSPYMSCPLGNPLGGLALVKVVFVLRHHSLQITQMPFVFVLVHEHIHIVYELENVFDTALDDLAIAGSGLGRDGIGTAVSGLAQINRLIAIRIDELEARFELEPAGDEREVHGAVVGAHVVPLIICNMMIRNDNAQPTVERAGRVVADGLGETVRSAS